MAPRQYTHRPLPKKNMYFFILEIFQFMLARVWNIEISSPEESGPQKNYSAGKVEKC